MNNARYIKTWVVDVKESLIPLNIKDYSFYSGESTSKFCCGRELCSFIDIFKECDELKDKENLDFWKDNQDFFWIGFLFVPNTKTIYLYISLEYDCDSDDWANKICRASDNKKYIKYIFDHAINLVNKAYNLKNEIIIQDSDDCKYCELNSNNEFNIHTLSADGCAFPIEQSIEGPDPTPIYAYVNQLHFTVAVAKRNIIIELKNELEKAYDDLKKQKQMNNNSILLNLKRNYIDFLNIDSEEVSRTVSTKEKNEIYEDLCKHFQIDEINKEYLNKLNVFEDLVKTEVDQKNIVLVDTLNTIQIASIILTMIGWALVILQGNLPQGNIIYIFAILFGGCVSVILAIVIKKLVSK